MANPALTEDAVNTGAVAWVLTSAALVFLMTAGLGFFYGGLVRDTNVINTMMMSVASMAIVCLTWVVFGFSWAFGDNGGAAIGNIVGNFDYSLWMNLDMKMWGDSGLPGLCFAAFQMTFAIIASAIISGSLVERMRFSAYAIMLALWSLLIYAPLCHWVWGPGGWIAEMGALDFAGGTVVHISSGVSGLVAGAIVGPRRHVEKELGPANAPFVILGGSLLWFGWLGFNGGSALSVSDGVAARAVATTFVAAASSMLSWLMLERLLKGKSSSVGASVGAVAGLVCITPGAGFVTPGWSIAIGALGAVWCYVSVELVNKANLVDDTLDAFGLHGMGGIGGAILTGIFALDGGLIYTGNFELLAKQIAGAMAGVAFSAVGTAIIVVALRLVMKLRIPEEQEIEGVDQHTHGETYHSPVKKYPQTTSESSEDAIDSNQGGYFEQMLLLPCALGEFRRTKQDSSHTLLLNPRIVGFAEHITSDIGSLGDFAAGAETAFGTVLQRCYAFLGARMHYGHPDMMNKEFMIQQGGISKATKMLNLSEDTPNCASTAQLRRVQVIQLNEAAQDIFAGMDFTLRGKPRSIVHREYLHVGKGRDLGFNSVLFFFAKLSQGTGEQLLTRQMFRLGHEMDLPEFLTFYYAHAGYYLTQFLLSKCIPMLVFIWLLVVLDDPEQNFPAMEVSEQDGKSGAVVIARMLITQFAWLVPFFLLAQTAPLFLQVWWEKHFLAATIRILKQIVTLAPLHFIFQAKVIGANITREITLGGAKYKATGRQLPTHRAPFIGSDGLYNDYAVMSLYDGAQLFLATILVMSTGGLAVDRSIFWSMFWWVFAVSLTIGSWLLAPFIFNPYQFTYTTFTGLQCRGAQKSFVHWLPLHCCQSEGPHAHRDF
eukprot:g11468.t1